MENGAVYAVYHNKNKNKFCGEILGIFEDKKGGKRSSQVE